MRQELLAQRQLAKAQKDAREAGQVYLRILSKVLRHEALLSRPQNDPRAGTKMRLECCQSLRIVYISMILVFTITIFLVSEVDISVHIITVFIESLTLLGCHASEEI